MLERPLYRIHAFVHRIDGWFKQRFTGSGMLLTGLLVLAGVFGVNTRANLAYQLALLAIALLAAAMLSALWFRADVSLRRRLPRYASDGDPVHYVIEVHNHSRRVQRGLLIQELVGVPAPGAGETRGRLVGYTNWVAARRRRGGAHPRPVPVPDVPPGGRVEVALEWRPLRRGYVRLSGCALLCPDPLGLFYAVKRIRLRDSLLVIPKRYPVDWTAWTGQMRDKPGGLKQAASTSGVEEFASLREYRPGDALRHIDWKGWARLGTPIVKEYFETCFVRQALILDTWLPTDAPRARFEAAVSVAASFVASGPAALRGALDLIFVGTSVHRVSANTGVGSLDGVLEALACVAPQPHRQFAMLTECIDESAGELSACVCVLLAWDDERRALVSRLRRIGVPLLVLVLEDAPTGRVRDPGPMVDQPQRFKVLPAQGLAGALAGLTR
ncbi:MAG: DUF58 domain-containing protein [Gammaproteobacteria bacterium]|nr:DUF58 domain-containing protein [Gammaproteobacteria bacterium]NIM72747.1 DUF58 domain-containing protein [Gammaproteobacteria bacterium]NIN38204.1 DUF58 domain-containing protein [Gammaproteobacteria bacterium]NIO65104.1 DUF58 domain-containing protein [Gammaproteobacteria bacterium]NIP45084.1 DUF58 domain-containing protein [Gammaproteobacteria bacterium]